MLVQVVYDIVHTLKVASFLVPSGIQPLFGNQEHDLQHGIDPSLHFPFSHTVRLCLSFMTQNLHLWLFYFYRFFLWDWGLNLQPLH